MNTIEAGYVTGIALLVIAALITGGMRLHGRVTQSSAEQLRIEAESHRKDGEKLFRPEEFMRRATLLQGRDEGEDE